MANTSVLSLGTRKDAGYWSDTAASTLNYTSTHKITAPKPSLADIKRVFSASDDWLFLGGHFTHASHLYNETGDVMIRFESNQVKIDHPDGAVTLKKGNDFKQHGKLKALFWGGCDVHSSAATVKTMRALFGNPLMIGWHGTTGWEVLHSVMGGYGNSAPHSTRDFFDRVKSNPLDAITVRKAWLDTAGDTTWGSATPTFESRFSVIMPDGSEHKLPKRAQLTS